MFSFISVEKPKPGTDFIGQLDAAGNATASLYLKHPLGTDGLVLCFSYIVLSPGATKPVLMASNPVNAIVALLED